MDWRLVLWTAILLRIHNGSGESWRNSCPSSYEEWTRIAADSGSDPVIFPPEQLSMTFTRSFGPDRGYKPLTKYELTLKIDTGEHKNVEFEISAIGESDCGTGLFVVKDHSINVHQMFCRHKIESPTKHLSLYWKAPECGCVSFMIGAISEGKLLLGDDYTFLGKQAHKICPVESLDDSEEEESEDFLEDVLDPEFYGIDEEEKDVTAKKDIRSMKKIYKTKKMSPMAPVTETPDVTCKDHVCRKVQRVIYKHNTLYNKFQKWPRKLCTLADSYLPMKQSVLDKLSDPHREWVESWKKWKVNVRRCCGQGNSTELADCLNVLGPLSMPWGHVKKPVIHKNSAWTPEHKLSSICGKVSKLEWGIQTRPGNFHKKKNHLKRKYEEFWHKRRDSIMDCCEVSNHDDRMTCITDVREEKIDEMCSGIESPFPGGMAQPRNLARKKRRMSRKCCAKEDEERYACVDAVYQWSKFGQQYTRRQHEKKSARKSQHNKATQDEMNVRNKCCNQGKVDGIEIAHRRWAMCNHRAGRYAEAQHFPGHKNGVCKRLHRQCCVKQSHRTIVQDPMTTTEPTPEEENLL